MFSSFGSLLSSFWLGDSHPLSKVRNNVRLCPNVETLIVLFSTGSYCPVHVEHIRLLEVVKEDLEMKGNVVVGGYLSPSHDEYVFNKMKRAGCQPIKGFHRLKMIELALQDSTWLSGDGWEVKQKWNMPATMAYRHLESTLREKVDQRIVVYYVCGADLAYNQQLYAGSFTMPIICIGRPNYTEKLKAEIEKRKNSPNPSSLMIVDKEMEDISSTKVRNLLERKEELEASKMCPPIVVAYLNHRL